MKTKQAKEDADRIDEDNTPELSTKTRARKKAADANEEQSKGNQDEPKTSKEPNTRKTIVSKTGKAIVKKQPLGIRKTLRNKKVVVVKDKLKNAIKQRAKRGRKPAIKVDPQQEILSDKDTVPLIPPSEIKKEPLEEVTHSSRSSSPKTGGRRPRISSDMLMMKSVLGDSPTSLVLGPRTSPYSMRSERSLSPSVVEVKNLRSSKPRKQKTNLLNEVVKNEQKKRRLLSDSKVEQGDLVDDGRKRGRSCSRDGSEISKCSDVTESDISLCETVSNDTEGKVDNQELIKKVDKPKTDIDVDIESSIPISTINTKVPCCNDDSKLGEVSLDMDHNNLKNQSKKMSLKRSTSLDSDNNNSRSRLKLDNVHNSSDIEDKSKVKRKTDKDALFKTRSNILTCMSKTFNSKEVTKNIRKARRGRKVANMTQTSQSQAKNGPSITVGIEPIESGPETLEILTDEINNLISSLDDDKIMDIEIANAQPTVVEVVKQNSICTDMGLLTKSVPKFHGISEIKPLADNNTNVVADILTKDKDIKSTSDAITQPEIDSENFRLSYDEEEPVDKTMEVVKESDVAFKCVPVASIDKLMDRLKEFEEFDKRRQSELMKSTESKSVMVTSDVVLIPKSGADIKPLKDIQTVRSPEKPLEKENVLSCFENNSAISIVKRDHVRKSLDVELPNSVTLIKRNSIHSRKESTGSKESADAISIFEKSLGKDVTLTEIRKSVDKSNPSTPAEIHQFSNLHPNSSGSANGNTRLTEVVIDSKQISITPRSSSDQAKKVKSSDIQLTKRRSRDSTSRKSSETTLESEIEKTASLEKVKSAPSVNNHQIKSPSLITPSQPPVAIKSPEAQPMDTEALAPPLESVKTIPEHISMTSETPKIHDMDIPESSITKLPVTSTEIQVESEIKSIVSIESKLVPKNETIDKTKDKKVTLLQSDSKISIDKPEIKNSMMEVKVEETPPATKPAKGAGKAAKSLRNSIESQAGPSNMLVETPESQKHKESVLRTLGLLTHKAANEAKVEKQKEKERIYAKTYGPGAINKNKATKSTGDYTGTLKTIIKLNRTSGEREKGKKYRSSLKMTFQKSKNRAGKPVAEVGEAASEDEAFYTIERREGVSGTSPAEGAHRKSHYSNRFNHDANQAPVAEPSTEAVKEPTPNLVIPEKASSFSIHPGRLCKDQCCYCGGKFGLFDTPCHIAQMKSAERQKKVLDNEEKLTVDSCLCDACYRHVDRRANCPSYRKRPLNKALATADMQPNNNPDIPIPNITVSISEKSISPPLEEESEEESPSLVGSGGASATCHAAACGARAQQAIRRKWLIKMRSRVNTLLKLELDYPGLHTIPLCGEHYRALAPLMTCVLCRRRVTKHHNVHLIKHGYQELNPLLTREGIPVQFTERPVLCKLCRYYCTLLQRPGINDKHANNYRNRLLQIYNIAVPMDIEHIVEDNKHTDQDISINSKQKKKNKVKSNKRKSLESSKGYDETLHEPTIEIHESPEKINTDDNSDKPPNLEEDIESLISSNRILVPNKPAAAEGTLQSEISELEAIIDLDGPLITLDKQTELQYLLQKQNNPAQFLPSTTIIQKQKNQLKPQSSGIQKPGLHHRLYEKTVKRYQKLGSLMIQKEKVSNNDIDMIDPEKMKDSGITILKNISLNDECTIESIPNKRPADINTLKNKWQMSESFTQVKKNLSELSKKMTTDKDGRKSSDVKYSNPVKRLETNPSISVRELFPGEEEMSLQCNIEFNNVRGVTPEGWEKCNTTIQYDTETKKLWNELQRPYGNQSSFIRHLVLLEKYFRNGDLVLAPSATTNAVNYSDSVQNRLRAYDNVPSDVPRRSEPSTSLIDFRKKPSINGKSLLKTNQSGDKSKLPEMKRPLPPGLFAKPKLKSSEAKSKTKPLPPELIAINTTNTQKSIQNVLHNIQQLVKGVSAPDPTEIASAPLPPPPAPPLPPPKVDIPIEEPKPPVSTKKQKTTSKPWRPTLMPITPENLAKIGREPTQVAVDGRSLPSLVQVMSSGKRYHITLQDYNKMCIMRREKLQQLQDGEAKTKRLSIEGGDTTLVTEIQTTAILGNGGTVKQTIDKADYDKKSELNDLNQIGANAATILKNVGLKNITIAPITAKTATITSHSVPVSTVTSPSLLKLPHLGPSVTITSETVYSPTAIALPVQSSAIIMPKIPKSLSVIPQLAAAPVLPIAVTGTIHPTPSDGSKP